MRYNLSDYLFNRFFFSLKASFCSHFLIQYHFSFRSIISTGCGFFNFRVSLLYSLLTQKKIDFVCEYKKKKNDWILFFFFFFFCITINRFLLLFEFHYWFTTCRDVVESLVVDIVFAKKASRYFKNTYILNWPLQLFS